MSGHRSGDPGRSSLARRAVRWVLLTGNRYVVAGGMFLAVLAVLLLADPVPGASTRDAQPVFYVFSALLSGNLSLLTIVLAVNQLVFQRELMSPGTFRSQLDQIEHLRSEVATALDRPAGTLPRTPPEFVTAVVDAVNESLADLEAAAERTDDEPLARELLAFAESLSGQLREVESGLGRQNLRTFDALMAVIDVHFTRALSDAERIRHRYEASISREAWTALGDTVRRLEQLRITEAYVKSLYTQEGLSRLSLALLYIGIPSQATLILVLLAFAAPAGSVGPPGLSPPVIYLGVAVGLAPLVVVFAFVLRATAVAYDTATTSQFRTRDEPS
ncbi:MAG: hypothetical protein ABEJ28_03590 [Salinigranum sp.]